MTAQHPDYWTMQEAIEEITDQLVRQFDPDVHTAAVGFQEVSNPERFGIADTQDERLVGVREKPADPPSHLAYIGAVVLSPLAFDVIRNQTPSERGELELTETIDALVTADGETYWDVIPGIWRDVGTPEDVIETNALLLQKQEQSLPDSVDTDQLSGAASKIRIGRDCSIDEEATIVGPAVIGDRVKISGASIVGPDTSIGDGSTISGTEISSSVVLQDVELSRATVSDSVIGSGATIRNTGSTEQPSRMVISRDSIVVGE
jgi:glucose-1-phosphate thymidylyltransferase